MTPSAIELCEDPDCPVAWAYRPGQQHWHPRPHGPELPTGRGQQRPVGKRGATEQPVHLLAVSGARRTMCGQLVTQRGPYPIMLLRHVPLHRAGHDRAGRQLVLCPDCESEIP